MKFVLALIALLLSLSPNAAAQGATREDRDVVRDLEEFPVGAQADELPTAVDLRPFLPPVGSQTMNDCAAWAFGYAARSYLERIDQGWGSAIGRYVFSPTFIYNQVNGGEDSGSRVDKVIELLMTKGAATLETAPYLANDYLSQPSEAALEEAGTFRIAGYYVVTDGEGVRRALAEGHVVLCCVRTNPIFNSGRYGVYTADKHREAHATRRADQPHGFHAMAIVGYSDDREAFLFMNSWGKSWGQNGFVWIGYDALETFNGRELTENLVDFAVVMVDRREPVARVDGKWEVVEMDSLQAHAFGAYAAYGDEGSEGAYRYTVHLRGDADALGAVEEVAWTVPTADGERTITTTDARASFRLTGRSEDPAVSITGVARTAGGHEVPLAASFEVPAAEKRSIRLERHDAAEQGANGAVLWRWTVVPRMSDADWRDLVRIRYVQHDATGPWDWIDYRHDGGLPAHWTLTNGAMPTYRSNDPRRVTAYFEFRDGTTHEIEIPADPFTDAARDEVTIEWDWRLEGDDGDRRWYFYELRVRYPENWADNILGVRVGVGSGPSFRSIEAQAVGGPGPRMHVVHGYAQRPFAPRGTVFFREPMPGRGMSTPATAYEVLEFDELAAWTEPELEPGVILEGHGFGIEAVDRYVGEVDGEPVWDVDLNIGGSANVMVIYEATWTLPSGERSFARGDASGAGPLDGYRVTERTSGPFRVAVECKDHNGTPFRLEREVIPHAPRNDALGVDVTSLNVEELREATPDRVVGEVSPLGLDADLAGLRRVRVFSRRSWGGVIPIDLVSFAFNEPREIRAASMPRVELPRHEPSVFVLDFDDGSAVAVEALPHFPAPERVPPRLQLLARERFEGWQGGRPTYGVDLELRGDLDVLQHLEAVEWSGAEVGADAPCTPEPDSDDLRRASTRVANEAAFSAALRFTADSGIEDVTLDARVLAASRRYANDLAVRVELGYFRDLLAEAGPSADPFAFPPPIFPFRVNVVGSAAELDEVAEVRFRSQAKWAFDIAANGGDAPDEPARATIADRDGLFGGFGWTVESVDGEAQVVGITLVMRDGEERALPDVIVGEGVGTLFDPYESAPVDAVRDWGEIDGRRAGLLLAAVPATPSTKHLVRGEFLRDRPLVGAGDSPIASFERGELRREFLFFEPGELTGVAVLRRDIHDRGFDVDAGFDRDTYDDGFPVAFHLSPTIATPRIDVDREEGTDVLFVRVTAPESVLARVQRVSYELTWSDRTRTIEVTDRIGERTDAFELRLVGEEPAAIVATLHGPDGPIEGGVLER